MLLRISNVVIILGVIAMYSSNTSLVVLALLSKSRNILGLLQCQFIHLGDQLFESRYNANADTILSHAYPATDIRRRVKADLT
jgi:hypothetical protein